MNHLQFHTDDMHCEVDQCSALGQASDFTFAEITLDDLGNLNVDIHDILYEHLDDGLLVALEVNLDLLERRATIGFLIGSVRIVDLLLSLRKLGSVLRFNSLALSSKIRLAVFDQVLRFRIPI